ncbi:hypothetical protein LSAT2_029815 [Lamellibrachia satsuma]|nr:hypothetical protein LSAT2_029815 [Lamellibrachia satsuma]
MVRLCRYARPRAITIINVSSRQPPADASRRLSSGISKDQSSITVDNVRQPHSCVLLSCSVSSAGAVIAGTGNENVTYCIIPGRDDHWNSRRRRHVLIRPLAR